MLYEVEKQFFFSINFNIYGHNKIFVNTKKIIEKKVIICYMYINLY